MYVCIHIYTQKHQGIDTHVRRGYQDRPVLSLGYGNRSDMINLAAGGGSNPDNLKIIKAPIQVSNPKSLYACIWSSMCAHRHDKF